MKSSILNWVYIYWLLSMIVSCVTVGEDPIAETYQMRDALRVKYKSIAASLFEISDKGGQYHKLKRCHERFNVKIDSGLVATDPVRYISDLQFAMRDCQWQLEKMDLEQSIKPAEQALNTHKRYFRERESEFKRISDTFKTEDALLTQKIDQGKDFLKYVLMKNRREFKKKELIFSETQKRRQHDIKEFQFILDYTRSMMSIRDLFEKYIKLTAAQEKKVRKYLRKKKALGNANQ